MRNMEKLVKEYNDKHTETFYAGDLLQIRNFAEKEAHDATNILLSAIYAALRAGYVVGYNKAMRDAKKAK